jgi:murein L,D-transpeptidase YcbB/YkuD
MRKEYRFWLIAAAAGIAATAGLASLEGASRAAPNACADPLSATGSFGLDLTSEETAAIRRFYINHNDGCAWSDQSEATLEDALGRASDQGLDADRYHPDALRRPDYRSLAARDVAATAMALRYAHDMTSGRIALTQIDDDVAIPAPPFDAMSGLAEALERGDLASWLKGLEPEDPAYRRLVSALAAYRAAASRGGWTAIPSGPTLNLGQVDPRVDILRRRLRAEGDLATSPSGPLFDQATKQALQSFQRRHGLADDGRLGPATIAALNVPANDRLDQILANLERWRILGRALSATGVTVNAAAATAMLTEDHRLVLSMRAIVGDKKHPTPMLLSAIDAVVLNPPWVVPRSIIKHEIEPALRRDPGYLEKNRMSWIGNQLVQAPGPKNSLGLIKFDLPNPFSVYMHDTPARSLFTESMRARSHGCVRLERPLDLAIDLLKGDPAWSRDHLVSTIDRGATVKAPLPRRVSVAFLYWTVFVDDDGTVEFRDDLYGRDARLLAALRRQRPAPLASAHSEVGCETG